MDRGSPYLSWMIVPACAVLILSALSMPRQPFTGLLLRGDQIVSVVPGSPAARADLRPADRLLAYPPTPRPTQNPLAAAAPDSPVRLLRERDGRLAEIALVPTTLPARERRMMAGLLAVASGFVLLGGWVWSQRRDGLTRAFMLLCLAFACLITPFPRFPWPRLAFGYEILYSGVTVFVPALFVHFFALFPERAFSARASGSLIRIAYSISTALFVVSTALTLLPGLPGGTLESALDLLQSVAALWFAAGVLVALALFARSYLRARSDDAHRRLRVALIGTVLGVAPLVTVVLTNELLRTAAVPGGRWAVPLTLFVPASFAWAILVHRVFEVRVALRAGVALAALAILSGLVYALGEWLAQSWRTDLGTGIAGGGLAFLALAASVAGPAGSWLRGVGDRILPGGHERSLAEWMTRHASARHGSSRQRLEAACATIAERLLLDGCAALEVDAAHLRPSVRIGRTRVPSPEALDTARGRLTGGSPIGLDDPRLSGALRPALEAAGVSWVLPVGDERPRALLLLGRRMSGPWLSIPEVRELGRFAHHLDVLLENAELREVATAHGAYDRDLTRAQAIQAHFLPRQTPAYPSLDCAAGALSTEPVGGDYYDFVKARGRVLTLAVGDAAGHGVPAALVGVWAQACFRSEARRGSRPAQVLAALNRELVSMEQPESFVALVCAQLEVPTGRLQYSNAGLTPPLLRRRDGTCESLAQSGVLLGVTPGATYENTAVDLRAGDVLVLHTDGLTEARRGEELFGPERLAAAVDRLADRRAAEIVRALMAEVQAFADRPLDDLTLVVIKQLEGPRRAAGRVRVPLKWRREHADALG